jgi:hypothetical protein
VLVTVQFGQGSAAAASLAGRRVGARRKSAGGGLPLGAFNSWLEKHRALLPEEPTGREVASWRKAFLDGVRQRNPRHGGEVTDRAKRYRAQKAVKGPKECVLCGSTQDLGVMHLDGDESHGEPANLAWGCRSCNQRLSAGFKRAGAGRRTAQYNPSSGVPTFKQYAWAVTQGPGGSHHGPYSGGGFAAGAHDEAGAIIHATPKFKRIEYAQRLASGRSARREEVPF